MSGPGVGKTHTLDRIAEVLEGADIRIALAAPTAEAARAEVERMVLEWRAEGYGYWLLVLAGYKLICSFIIFGGGFKDCDNC